MSWDCHHCGEKMSPRVHFSFGKGYHPHCIGKMPLTAAERAAKKAGVNPMIQSTAIDAVPHGDDVQTPMMTNPYNGPLADPEQVQNYENGFQYAQSAGHQNLNQLDAMALQSLAGRADPWKEGFSEGASRLGCGSVADKLEATKAAMHFPATEYIKLSGLGDAARSVGQGFSEVGDVAKDLAYGGRRPGDMTDMARHGLNVMGAGVPYALGTASVAHSRHLSPEERARALGSYSRARLGNLKTMPWRIGGALLGAGVGGLTGHVMGDFAGHHFGDMTGSELSDNLIDGGATAAGAAVGGGMGHTFGRNYGGFRVGRQLAQEDLAEMRKPEHLQRSLLDRHGATLVGAASLPGKFGEAIHLSLGTLAKR